MSTPAPSALASTRAGTIEYRLSGQGAPVFLLFSGAGVPMQGWAGLYPGIEALGRVLAWNRPGLGRSSRPRGAQTGEAVVSTLRELLAHCGLGAPYILVGHSLGGLHASLFARRHPDEVRGVVMLEATHPAGRGALREHEGRLAAVLGRLMSLPQQWLRANLHAELSCVDETARQVAAAGPFPPVPHTVVSAGQDPPRWLAPPQALRARRAHQRELAQLSPLGEQVIATKSGHFPQRSEPELVLEVLRNIASRSATVRAAPAAPAVPIRP